MTDEERQRQMDFMLEQQAQFTVNFQKADERFKASESRLDRLERVLMLAIRTGQRERKETREKFNTLVNAQIRTDAAMSKMAEAQSKMAEAQTHTDGRLDALIDIIQEGRNGKGNGSK